MKSRPQRQAKGSPLARFVDGGALLTSSCFFFAMIIVAGAVAWTWHRMGNDDAGSCGVLGWLSYTCSFFSWIGNVLFEKSSPQDYLPVSATEPESGLELPVIETGIASTDEAPTQAMPIFGSLKTLGIAAKEAALSRTDFDFGLGRVTRRLMSVSTRVGTSRPGSTMRSRLDDGDGGYGYAHGDADWEDEVRGLLHVGSSVDDEDAAEQADIAAFMKLRPAARDSIGDDEDQVSSARPLVGTDRAGLLSR